MADSVIGGSNQGTGGLTDNAKDAFDKLSQADKDALAGLGDTGNIETAYVGAPRDGNVYVQGSGVEDGHKVTIGSVAPSTTGPIDGHIPNGNMSVDVHIPLGTGFNMAGPTELRTALEANDYFGAFIDSVLPGESSYKDAFNAAVSKASAYAGDDTAVRLITIDDNSAGSDSFTFKGSSVNETVVINAYGPGFANPVKHDINISDFDGAVIVGPASVNVIGTAGAFVTGDAANQKITGSAGGDTLIGGGGSDILTGGSGGDTFGVGFGGDTMVTDFNGASGDKLLFEGSMTLQSFLQADISVVQLGTFAVTNISSEGHNIYLVGVDPSTLTLDMIKFDV
ncbi:MAG: hypothetical protein QX199_14735 [Methylococcaceae bacterium]